MAFCINCGHELQDGAKFCGNCGKAINDNNSACQRKTVYDGEIHKCPSCGEILNSFVSECPSCGYELRGAKASTSVSEFALKLELASTERQTITLIKNYPIPNTKEDIYEYMIIAASNIASNSNREVFDAWKVRFEQSYQKAKLLLKDDPSLSELQVLYGQTQKKIQKIEASRNAKTIGVAIGKSGKATGQFILQNAYALPSIVICSAWIISIFVLIPLCRGLYGDDYQLFLFFDFIAGAILIPTVARIRSSMPKLIVSVGLAASIAILIPLCKGLYGDDYQMMLFFDIIATTVIVVRMFRKPKKEE